MSLDETNDNTFIDEQPGSTQSPGGFQPFSGTQPSNDIQSPGTDEPSCDSSQADGTYALHATVIFDDKPQMIYITQGATQTGNKASDFSAVLGGLANIEIPVIPLRALHVTTRQNTTQPMRLASWKKTTDSRNNPQCLKSKSSTSHISYCCQRNSYLGAPRGH